MIQHRFDSLGDIRLWLLAAALVCAAAGAARPHVERERPRLNALVVVDITGSMNVRDYLKDGKPQSRLEFAKGMLTGLIRDAPCGSRVGLAIFSERRPFLLFAPIETCENYAPIAKAISELDWRMAWEGDSHIASGIYKSIDLAQSLAADLIFLTDGQESPPPPYTGPPAFQGTPGLVHGILAGAGARMLSPIPKFDERGREIGFLSESDVPQELRSGLPPPGAERRPGYNPRNAPFGGEAAHGNEHMSSVHEEYLRSLAAATGLGYVPLSADTGLLDAAARRAAPQYVRVPIDLAPWLAGIGLLALAAAYVVDPSVRSFRNIPKKFRRRRAAFVSPQ